MAIAIEVPETVATGFPMNRRLLTILFSAFVIAAICAFLVWRMVGNRLQAATRQSATTAVVAAASDIKLGKVLTASDLTMVDIGGSLPKGALLKPEQAVGRGVVANLYQGEPILDERLAPVGSGGGLAATIPPGMRACAVKVDEVVGVAGFVTPGMRVDVLISGDPPGRENVNLTGQKVKTLLQNIQVLSAGTDIQKDNEGKPRPVQVVNLLVSPDQAEVLSLASSQTHIQLVLRNPTDTKIAPTSGTFVSNLFADSKTAPVKSRPAAVVVKKPAPAYTVEVINGTQRSNQKFATPEGQK
jgi:pilus assembly protein CpaB